MTASSEPHAGGEPSPLYPGHPFGGLVRDGGPGMRAVNSLDDERRDAPADDDEAAGFDFHLGVYARF